MAIKETLAEINEDVKDVVSLGFELSQTQGDYVPHFDDPGLTFENGQVKKAKLIETCVLYADIRKSTELSKVKSKEVMARLYTAFVTQGGEHNYNWEGYDLTEGGIWEFTNNKRDLKIHFQNLPQHSPFLTTEVVVWSIQRLTNKQMWWKTNFNMKKYYIKCKKIEN